MKAEQPAEKQLVGIDWGVGEAKGVMATYRVDPDGHKWRLRMEVIGGGVPLLYWAETEERAKALAAILDEHLVVKIALFSKFRAFATEEGKP